MRTTIMRAGAVLGAAVATLLAAAAPASAHEKWFVPDPATRATGRSCCGR